MDNPILALIASFITMAFIVISYFVRRKTLYLLYQMLGLAFLVVSYFFTMQFFAMVGLGIAILRVLTYYFLERKGKNTPLYLAVIFTAMSVVAYLVVNLWILKDAQPIDILFLIATAFYAFIFRMRNLKAVRFWVLLPAGLSIMYNAVSSAAIFALLTYIFEFSADVVSIFKYHIIGERKSKSKNNKQEQQEGEILK